MLRVTGGKYCGAHLHCPPKIRPTSGRIKEYIFSQVGEKALEARVLDLFAGSGALGIEALSRGASEAVFVDLSRHSFETVRKNLAKLKIKAKAVRREAFKFINGYDGAPFDIILIDPPYDKVKPLFLLRAVEESKLLAPEGLLVMEMDGRAPAPDAETLTLISFKKMGDTAVGMWERRKDEG